MLLNLNYNTGLLYHLDPGLEHLCERAERIKCTCARIRAWIQRLRPQGRKIPIPEPLHPIGSSGPLLRYMYDREPVAIDHCIQVVVYYGPMLFMVRTPDYTPPERIYIILILHNPIDFKCQGVYKKKIIA